MRRARARHTAHDAPTLAELCRRAAERLEQAGVGPDAARADVAVLARALLGWDLARWLTSRREPASAGFAARLDSWVERRARHEPVAYITGEREFYGRSFLVTPAVLIPRPDTETLVSAALACLDRIRTPAPVVVDVGTGSGCVAVTLAAERPAVSVVATDISGAALDVARRNAERAGVSDRVTFRQGPLLAGLERWADVIVSNPPYVREVDRATLPSDVALYEPPAALFGGTDGLDLIRLLIGEAGALLHTGGWLVFEIGSDQPDAVRALLDAAGVFEPMAVTLDIESRPRVVAARRRQAGVAAVRGSESRGLRAIGGQR